MRADSPHTQASVSNVQVARAILRGWCSQILRGLVLWLQSGGAVDAEGFPWVFDARLCNGADGARLESVVPVGLVGRRSGMFIFPATGPALALAFTLVTTICRRTLCTPCLGMWSPLPGSGAGRSNRLRSAPVIALADCCVMAELGPQRKVWLMVSRTRPWSRRHSGSCLRFPHHRPRTRRR